MNQTRKAVYEWARAFLAEDLLPRWLEHSPTRTGLFYPHFDREWNRIEKDLCTLVSQGRLLYVFAEGYRLTGEQAYLDEVNKGADALIRYFRDNDNGGWRYACSMSGEPIDARKDLYGFAFVIFGLAHAADITGRNDLIRTLIATWDTINARFRDGHGGWTGKRLPDFQLDVHTRSQNPLMHLFEALNAASEVDESGVIQAAGEEIGGFIIDRAVSKTTGRLLELFNDDWRPLPAKQGGYYSIGHSFEWAYLFSRAAERGWSQRYIPYGQRCLEVGIEGMADDGGVMASAAPDGTITAEHRGWWEQAEGMRALMHYGVVREHEAAWEPLQRLFEFVQNNYVDSAYGGFYMSPPGAKSDTVSLNKGSEWKADYHVVAMLAEIVRLGDR